MFPLRNLMLPFLMFPLRCYRFWTSMFPYSMLTSFPLLSTCSFVCLVFFAYLFYCLPVFFVYRFFSKSVLLSIRSLVYLFSCLSVYSFICYFDFLSEYSSVPLSICSFVYLFFCLSVNLSICPSVMVITYFYCFSWLSSPIATEFTVDQSEDPQGHLKAQLLGQQVQQDLHVQRLKWKDNKNTLDWHIRQTYLFNLNTRKRELIVIVNSSRHIFRLVIGSFLPKP